MKNTLKKLAVLLSILTLNSCAMPNLVTNPNNSQYPQSVSETHTKTTIVAPPSYGPAYMPPSAIYQVPAQQNLQQNMQQTPSFQQQSGIAEKDVSNVRYNIVSATPGYPEYVFIQKDKLAEPETK